MNKQFQHRPEKVQVGQLLIYDKSNIDGSNCGPIALFTASPTRLEAFKWHEGGSVATLVTAEMDWSRFSVAELQSWRIFANGERQLVAQLKQRESAERPVLDITIFVANPPIQQTIEIAGTPWHSYDFDFASLNATLRHWLTPHQPLNFHIADVDFNSDEMLFANKGEVMLAYEAEEERHGYLCGRYKIDGPGLEHKGGFIWVNQSEPFIVDYEIELPDEPGYETGKLQLREVTNLSVEGWADYCLGKLKDGNRE